jgi:hypothetical protein
MAGGNKSNSPKAKKRKGEVQRAAKKSALAKRTRWPNRSADRS